MRSHLTSAVLILPSRLSASRPSAAIVCCASVCPPPRTRSMRSRTCWQARSRTAHGRKKLELSTRATSALVNSPWRFQVRRRQLQRSAYRPSHPGTEVDFRQPAAPSLWPEWMARRIQVTPAQRPSQVRGAFRSPGAGLPVGFRGAIVGVSPHCFRDPAAACPGENRLISNILSVADNQRLPAENRTHARDAAAPHFSTSIISKV
jgi:hypothetical protein